MIDLTGQRFNHFIVLSAAPKKGIYDMWNVKCDCGSVQSIRTGHLTDGQKSCKACLHKRKTTHGMSHKKEYNLWYSMKRRCYNKKVHRYEDYGGRGIKVCDRWLDSFDNFLSDMGLAPSKDHSLDRFPNNNGNYEPNNCRWATRYEQSNNRRNNIIIEYNGETKRLMDFAKAYSISYKLAHRRFKKGWELDKVFSIK